MKKSEELLNAINDIDDKYILDAEPHTASGNPGRELKKILLAGFGAVAVIFVIIMAGGISVKYGESSPTNSGWPTEYIEATYVTEQETMITPHWDEMSIEEQFPWVGYNGIEYGTTGTGYDIPSVYPEGIGEPLGAAHLTGYDIYTDTTYETEAQLYAVNGISAECIIAVKFNESDDYYAYINSWYKPKTLGQFLEDLNLKDTISFGTIYYSYFKESGDYTSVEFTGMDKNTVFDMLLYDMSIENVDNYDSMYFHTIMSMGVNVPLLGNRSLSVTEEGYVITNILETGKAFYIGRDKVDEFVDYVKANCQGKEIVYVFETQEGDAGKYGNEEPETVVMTTEVYTE